MAVVAVNEKDVKLVKSGHGETKWLVPNKGGASPEVMIRHWGPETNIPVHSHPYHEMFYVLEGEIEIGDATYTAGSCIYIEKNTPTVQPARPSVAKCCAMRKRDPANRIEVK